MLAAIQKPTKLFSKGFFNELVERLNNDESLSKTTKGLSSSISLRCDQKPSCQITINGGRLSEREGLNEEDAEFRFSAPYTEWKRIAKGKVKLPGEVISGRVRFRGSMPKMLLYLNKVIGLEKKLMRVINEMNIDFEESLNPTGI